MGTVTKALTLAVPLIKKWEGFRAKPYLCTAGVPTIGYGSTFYLDGRKVTLQDEAIDENTANELLHNSINRIFLPATLRLCPVLINHPAKLAAIISFCYNLGSTRLSASTLRKRINSQDWDAAADELLKWVFSGGKKTRGLVLRRNDERNLFLMVASTPNV